MEKDCRCGCTGTIIVSIIIGIIAGIIYYSTTVSILIVGVWIVFGIAVGILAILLLAGLFGNNECLYDRYCLMVATVGTIITTILLLMIFFDLLFTSILVGFIVFFFSFMIMKLFSLFRCLCSAKCCYRK